MATLTSGTDFWRRRYEAILCQCQHSPQEDMATTRAWDQRLKPREAKEDRLTGRSRQSQNHRWRSRRPLLAVFRTTRQRSVKKQDWSNNSTHFAPVLFLEHHAKCGPLAGGRRVAVE